MKTAISVPDELFAHAERWAAVQGVSRSAFVAEALRRHVARLEAESLTAQIDAAIDLAGTDDVRDVVTANRRRLAAEDW